MFRFVEGFKSCVSLEDFTAVHSEAAAVWFVTPCTSAMDTTRRHMLSPSSVFSPQDGCADSSRRWDPVMRVHRALKYEDSVPSNGECFYELQLGETSVCT